MRKLEAVHAGSPAAGAPYTPALRAGNLLFISGQLGLDPETRRPHADFEKQVEGAIAGVRRLVEAAGGTIYDVVKTTVLLADIGDFDPLNAIYRRHFDNDLKPARTTFQVAALPLGARVEIEAVAYLER